MKIWITLISMAMSAVAASASTRTLLDWSDSSGDGDVNISANAKITDEYWVLNGDTSYEMKGMAKANLNIFTLSPTLAQLDTEIYHNTTAAGAVNGWFKYRGEFAGSTIIPWTTHVWSGTPTSLTPPPSSSLVSQHYFGTKTVVIGGGGFGIGGNAGLTYATSATVSVDTVSSIGQPLAYDAKLSLSSAVVAMVTGGIVYVWGPPPGAIGIIGAYHAGRVQAKGDVVVRIDSTPETSGNNDWIDATISWSGQGPSGEIDAFVHIPVFNAFGVIVYYTRFDKLWSWNSPVYNHLVYQNRIYI